MYQERALKGLNTVPALTAVGLLAVCTVANAGSSGASLAFSYPNGFAGATNAIQTSASAHFAGSAISLTSASAGQHQAGAAWYKTQQNIQSFTTDFTFQAPSGLAVPSTVGITFCVQNSNLTTNPTPPYGGVWYGDYAAADANLAGYGAYNSGHQYPIGNSVAIKFDLNPASQSNYPSGGSPSSTGLYIDGGPWAALVPQNDLNPYEINFYSGHIMAAHVVYDGSLLTLTLRDTSTNAQYRTSWPVNIPAIVGSNTAYVGFTSGTIPAVASNVLTWSFSQGYAPKLSAPNFSVAGGSYSSAQSVSLSAPAGATIYYTTNGHPPTTSSNQYAGPISVSSSEIVQAIAVEAGYTDSPVAVANYDIGPTGTPLINFARGFTNGANLMTVNGSARINGSTIQLTDTNTLEAGSAWYDVPVNVQSFTTNFTLQLLHPNANGMTFTIQNQPPASAGSSIRYVSGGPNAIGNNQSGLGYSGATGNVDGQNAGLLNSVAVKFDLWNGSGNTTGLYTNGADLTTGGIDMTGSGVNLHSGNPLAVTIGYDGTTLKMTITDTKTNASFSKSWAINIPAIVGGATAYVGFTGATGGQTALQDVLSWTYSTSSGNQAQSIPVPQPPTDVHIQ